MSSERFDKILRKNLESVRPAYEPRAWDRFSKRLPATGFFPWFQKYGGWALCGMMLAGWVTTLYTLRENQELIRRLVVDKSQEGFIARPSTSGLGNRDESSVNSAEDRLTGQKTDTIYVIQKTLVEHRHDHPNLVVTENLSPRKAESYTGNDPKNGQQLRAERSPYKVSSRSFGEAGQNYNSGTSEAKDDTRPEPVLEVKSGNPALFPGIPAANYGHLVHSDSLDKAIDKQTIMALIDSAWAEQAVKQRLSNAHVDSILDRYPYVQQRPVQIRPARPPFRLSEMQPRFGIESLLTPYSYGLGPSLEFFPTENLGVSIGIQASTLRAENHKKLRDYNSATGKLFVVQYSSYLPSRFDRIEDISIKTSVISLPISLKYYIPLKSNLSLFVQSGTSLDLSAYQRVDFESYLNKSKRRNTFETDAKPNLFHNFMFGAGVQYRKSRILAQLSPYYVYDFRNIENTPSGSNLGLRASVWLNLFK